MNQAILILITFFMASTAMAQSGQVVKYREKTESRQDFDGSVYVYYDSTHTDFFGETDEPALAQQLFWDDIGNNWEQKYRRYYTYNTAGQVTVYLTMEWFAPQFDSILRTVYTYDANGNKTEVISQSFDGANWVNNNRSEYIYNASNLVTQLNYQVWSSGAWLNNRRYNSTYDANGNLTTFTVLNWTAGAWENDYRNIYAYDANGQTQFDYQTWDAGAWVDNSRYLYQRDANGNVLVEKGLLYYTSTSIYDTLYRVVNTYNANNNVLTYLYQNENMGVYTNLTREIYTYNAAGIQYTRLQQDWDGTTWVNYERDSTLFDANNQKRMTERTRWASGAWGPYYKWHYQYEAYNDGTGIATIGPDLNWQVYPNPSASVVTFGFNRVELEPVVLVITDLAGRRIHTQTLSAPGHEISWQGTDSQGHAVAPGIYLYQLSQAGQVKQGKFVRQ